MSEWGAVDANGDGSVAHESVGEWQHFMRRHNLSHAAWAVSDKAEGASIFVPGAAAALGAWREEHLTESGRCVREVVKGHWGCGLVPQKDRASNFTQIHKVHT